MKNTLIAILVIAVVIIGYLFIKEKTKPVDYGSAWPETVPATPHTGTTTNTNPNGPDYTPPQNNQESMLDGQHLFDTSEGNPDARSTNRVFIVAAKLQYETNNPVCGNGNEFVSPCSFYMRDTNSNLRKITEWPTTVLKIKYPNSFDAYNWYAPGQAMFTGDKTIMFDTHKQYDCGGYDTEHWSFNWETGEYTLVATDKGTPNNCD